MFYTIDPILRYYSKPTTNTNTTLPYVGKSLLSYTQPLQLTPITITKPYINNNDDISKPYSNNHSNNDSSLKTIEQQHSKSEPISPITTSSKTNNKSSKQTNCKRSYSSSDSNDETYNKMIRRAKHKQVEIRRRTKLAKLFNELTDVLELGNVDKATLLAETIKLLKQYKHNELNSSDGNN